ncbi:ROK family transcriptional regulator [Bacillus taeanensis]|uniref:ROK family protein n=1 Tax=Bacillus taeanensis TaxID=273032 RepID=A0A366Y011_9BACI|nr:ROK family protein [Bacillus taeanensis]RBW69744.1 ROK family protein [Bacillus taeanensis]
MNVTGNIQLVKKMNKSIVLQMIKDFSPISRADISQKAGLNKGTVSSLVSELIDENLIYEQGPGKSSGGRRPVMLLFNEKAGYSIGIDLGVNYILGILTDLQGKIVKEKEIPLLSNDYNSTFKQLTEVIDFLRFSAPESPYGVVGIGLGVPGSVNHKGEILLAPNLEWKNKDIKAQLEAMYQLPIIIENEANAGAYGEMRFGADQDVEELIYISAGIGIGVGLIFKGELYSGFNGFAGEMGHMVIETNGKQCRCGSKGCWELYASEHAVLEKANNSTLHDQLNLQDQSKIKLKMLIDLAEQNNENAIQLFEEVGTFLGIGINNIINTFNPQKIIIGNRLSAAAKWLMPSVQQEISERTLTFSKSDLKVEFSKLMTYAASLGAAAFIAENFLNPPENNEGLASK